MRKKNTVDNTNYFRTQLGVLTPSGGAEAIDSALKIFAGEDVPHQITLDSWIFSGEDVDSGREALESIADLLW